MTIEQFRQIHEDWKQSGLSVQQYCENTGITESRFYYWKSKLKAEFFPSACQKKKSTFTLFFLLTFLLSLKSATKPFNVLLACTDVKCL